ncbi:MAG: GerAB/ArcD/ProY family transporter [Oscillospiraceae bacterium]|nr:GerAB/ArcD/ProY family transporter [Oscillospiraceae bacterium]
MRNDRITNGSGAAICALVIFANAYSVMSGANAGKGAWLAHLLAGGAATAFAWCLASVCERFPEKSFYEVLEASVGKWGARAAGALTAFFSLVTCVLSLTVFSRFVQITALARTPQIILPLILAIVSALALRTGMRAVSGAARLLFWFAAAVFAVFVLFGIRWMEPELLLPGKTGTEMLFGGAGEVFLNRFGTVFALFSVYSRMKPGNGRKKAFLLSVALSAVGLALVCAVTVATLGEGTVGTDFYPVFTAMSVRGVGGFIQHTEILACIAMTLSLFFKTSVCLMFAVDMLCGIFDIRKGKGFSLPLALICAAMTQLIYRDLSALRGMVEWTPGASWVVAVYALLPPVFLIGARIKKKSGVE